MHPMVRGLAIGSLIPAVWTAWSLLPRLDAQTSTLVLASEILCAVLSVAFWLVVAQGLWTRRRYGWRLALIGAAGVGLLGAVGLSLWLGQWVGLWPAAGGLSVEHPGLTLGLLIGLCGAGGGQAAYLSRPRVRDLFRADPPPWS